MPDLETLNRMIKDLETLDRMIKDLVRCRVEQTGPEQIYFLLMAYVTEITGISEKEILSKYKGRKVSDARCLLIYHMFHEGYTKYSISKVLQLNHTSVLAQLKKFKTLYDTDYEFRHSANKLNEVWKTHSATLS